MLVDRIGFRIRCRQSCLKISFVGTDRVVASSMFGFFVS